jgi:hypothetical protein
MRRQKSSNVIRSTEGKTKITSRQSASARVGQGGNAFAINASEIAVVRIRPQG